MKCVKFLVAVAPVDNASKMTEAMNNHFKILSEDKNASMFEIKTTYLQSIDNHRFVFTTILEWDDGK